MASDSTASRSQLDPKFFSLLEKKDGSEDLQYHHYATQYQLYATRPGSTMILQNGNTPIFALMFRTTKGQHIITKHKDNEFYGISDKECDMEFVLTNLLCTDDGTTSLNVQILDKSGFGRVNKVNCIFPGESIHVRGDARNDEYSMKMEIIKDVSTGESVTVAKSETSKDPTQKQTKFFISVVAQSENRILVDLVKGAKWICQDRFVRIVPPFPKPIPNPNESCLSDLCWNPFDSDDGADDTDDDEFTGIPKGITRYPSPERNSRPQSTARNPVFGHSCVRGENAPVSKSSPYMSMNFGGVGWEGAELQSAIGHMNEIRKKARPSPGFTVENAKATKIVKGETQHKTDTKSLDWEYDYENPAPKCTFGVCIWEHMDVEVYEWTKEEQCKMMNDAMKSRDLDMIDALSHKFESEECVICLEDKPTIVLAQCGHLCMCAPCFKKHRETNKNCPLCRGHILAGVPDRSLTGK